MTGAAPRMQLQALAGASLGTPALLARWDLALQQGMGWSGSGARAVPHRTCLHAVSSRDE